MKKLASLLLVASLLGFEVLHAAPPPVSASTMSVVVGEEQVIVFPTDRLLPQTFTNATRAATAPVLVGQVGWEIDTGKFYIADGTDAGDWSAYTLPFSSISSKPTTLSGYGITDAQPVDSDLSAIAALTTTSFGRGLLDDADAAALRSSAGLGTAATKNTGNASGDVPLLGASGDLTLTGIITSVDSVVISNNGFTGTFVTAGLTAPRTWIVPDSDGTVAFTTGAQTFSGKTYASPIITGAMTLPDNVRQVFNPGSTNSGFNVGQQAGNPSSLTNGDLWYNSSTNALMARVNGVTQDLGAQAKSPFTTGNAAYVFPGVGNDSTADGTIQLPYNTVQAAYDDGIRVFLLGDGDAGGLNIAPGGTVTLTFTGLGYNRSTVAGIQVTDGSNLVVYDGSFWSFGVTSTITTTPSTSAGSAGSIELTKVYASAVDVVAAGQASFDIGGNGGSGAQINLNRCVVNGIQTNGGPGGAGDGSTAGGNGGNGAPAYARHTQINASTYGEGGGAGADGGFGPGSPGANAPSYSFTFCEYGPAPTGYDSSSSAANIVSGTFVP